MNDIFQKLFSSIDNNIYETLDSITFIDIDIINSIKIQKIVGTSAKEGILLVCNALIFGIIIYYSINYLISHLTLSKVQSPMQFIFKLIIFSILMNSSLFICKEIINIISEISNIVRQIGENLFKESICFSNFVKMLNEKIYLEKETVELFSFDGIIKSFTTIGFVNLIFSNSLRYVIIQVLIIISPFAFLSLVSYKTEQFFKRWLISFVSLLVEQIFISVILILAFSIEEAMPETLIKLIFIGVLYALIRSNNYMNQLIGGVSTTIETGINTLKGK